MATSTQDILKKAQELGDLIAEHDSARKLADAMARLEKNAEAQRAMHDLDRHYQAVAEKQAAGKPIEVEDKRKLEQLQLAMAKQAVLRDLQVAQMDYMDLLRSVDDAIQGGGDAEKKSHG